jgi:hypothetical protein
VTVDVAVELAPKEADYERARVLNRRRVEELASRGRHFRNFLEVERWWYREMFQFLKGRSRVIALADYAAEEDLHFGGFASSTDRHAGADFYCESGHPDAMAAKSASPRNTLLTELTSGVQKRTIKNTKTFLVRRLVLPRGIEALFLVADHTLGTGDQGNSGRQGAVSQVGGAQD